MHSRITLQVIRRIMVNEFDWLTDGDCILAEHRLREDLELDSLAMVSLQVAIEDEFEIRFDPVQPDPTVVFHTVGSLAHFLEDHLGLNPGIEQSDG